MCWGIQQLDILSFIGTIIIRYDTVMPATSKSCRKQAVSTLTVMILIARTT